MSDVVSQAPEMLTGGCMCGAVRYATAEKPLAGARVVCRIPVIQGDGKADIGVPAALAPSFRTVSHEGNLVSQAVAAALSQHLRL